MILLFDIIENVAGLGMAVGVSAIVGLITYIFNHNREENKSRIDTRSKEIYDLGNRHHILEKDVQELKTKMTNVEKSHDNLAQLVKDNHNALMAKVIEILQRLPR